MIKLNGAIKFIVANPAMLFAMPRAFDGNKAGWKMSADGKTIEVDAKGNPIWINASGAEAPVEGDAIARLNAEARQHRVDKEKAETALKAFDGIDPVTAKKAIDTVKNIDTKKLIDAGEVEKVRETMRGEFTNQLNEKDKALIDLQSRYDGLNISNVFANSEFIRENIAVPPDMFEATFRGNFKMKDGKLEAYDKNGNRLMSKKNNGDYAEPNEALAILVEQHPQKDTILKAPNHKGTGNTGQGGGRSQARTMLRADFDALSPNDQAAQAAAMGKGELTIVDGR